MATGETLFILRPQGSSAPSANAATFDVISDTSTPNTKIRVLDFDGGTNEHADWHVDMPSHYDGGGLTFAYKYATDGTQTNLVEIEFRVVNIADATDLTGDLGVDTATAVAIQDTPPATPANKINHSTTGNLTHANAGSPAVDDSLVIRATRDTAAASNTDDLQLVSITVVET